MSAFRREFGSRSAALFVLALVSGCVFAGTSSPTSPSCPAAGAPAPTSTADSEGRDLVIVGRIVTMDEPAEAEALFIEAGLVTCVGTRDEVMAAAGGCDDRLGAADQPRATVDGDRLGRVAPLVGGRHLRCEPVLGRGIAERLRCECVGLHDAEPRIFGDQAHVSL